MNTYTVTTKDAHTTTTQEIKAETATRAALEALSAYDYGESSATVQYAVALSEDYIRERDADPAFVDDVTDLAGMDSVELLIGRVEISGNQFDWS